MPYKNPEEAKAQKQRWRANNPDYMRKWHLAHPHFWRERGRSLLVEVVGAYGGKCAMCGEVDLNVLTLDHVNGGGKAHRRAIGVPGGRAGDPFYRRLKALGFPSTPPLQVLCVSCHKAKGGYLSFAGRGAVPREYLPEEVSP